MYSGGAWIFFVVVKGALCCKKFENLCIRGLQVHGNPPPIKKKRRKKKSLQGFRPTSSTADLYTLDNEFDTLVTSRLHNFT